MTDVTTLAAGGTSGSAVGSTGPRKVTHEINIADAVTAGLTTGGKVRVATMPADTYFRLLQVKIVNAIVLGGSADFTLGDTDDDEFITTTATLTAGLNLTIAKQNGSDGDVYLTADTINMKLTGDNITAGTATGLIRFVWLQMDTARNAPADTV